MTACDRSVHLCWRDILLLLSAGALGVCLLPGGGAVAAQADRPQAGGGRSEKGPPPSELIAYPSFGRGVSEWWQNAEVQKQLQLRPSQITDIERSWKQHVSSYRPVREVLSRKWQAIDEAIAEQKISPDELRHLFMVAEALRSDANTSRVVTLYKIFLILDLPQRDALRAWLARQPVEPSRGRRSN